MIPAYRYEKYNPAVVLMFFVTIIITGEVSQNLINNYFLTTDKNFDK